MRVHNVNTPMKSLLCSLIVTTAILSPVALRAQDAAPAATPAAAPEVKYDFGDHSSATLTGKAWKANESQDWAAVKAYTGKCRELYLNQALEMQGKLTEAAPKETANQYWALNDVGTSTFILAQALEKSGDTKGAIEMYKFVVEKTPFAQCWDPKGWFWKPADAANGRIKALEFDAMN